MANHAILRLFHAGSAAKYKSPSLISNNTISYPQNFRLLLSSCKSLNSLLQIHGHLVVSGLEHDHFLATHLINSYSFFHRCELSCFVFNSLTDPSVIVWNSIIRAYSRSNRYKEALQMYHNMLETGLEPDKHTFTFALKACTGALDFQEGVLIRREIARRKLEFDVFIGTGLVGMYSKMGDLKSAFEVFDNMPKKDVVAWNAIIAGLSQNQKPCEALEYFRIMQVEGMEPNSVSLLNLVPAVSKLEGICSCRSIHGYVVKREFGPSVSNGLIDMYSKCGDVKVARRVFDMFLQRDDVSWGTMMAGYAYNGFFSEVLYLFDFMKSQNLKMNKVSALSAILAAGEMIDLERGNEILDCALQQRIDFDIFFTTSIITMYVKCGELEKGQQLFQKLQERDLIAWSALISACSQSGYSKEALNLFRGMQNENLKPDLATITSILPLCAELSCLRIGRSIHCYIVKASIDSDISIGTALAFMYVKSGYFSSALTLFNRMQCKDVVIWNAIINGYAQNGDLYSAILMFRRLQLSIIPPNAGTMVGLLQACAILNDIRQGSSIHGQIIKRNLESDSYVKSALINMYAKCGSILSAELLFKRTNITNDVVSWNALIAGYLQNGHSEESISTFLQLRLHSMKPNLATFVTILPAAAHLTNLPIGTTIHSCIIQMGFLSNRLLGNSLIDMYAKCGCLDYSEKVFSEMENKDAVSWNVMLAGYAAHGQGESAITLFSLMKQSQVPVDSVSFLSVLSACGHSGLIKKGREVFQSMCEEYRIKPNVEHYACMVDLLGRAGLFDETLFLINNMPMVPDASVWGALLGASRMHSNIKLAEVALNHLVQLEPRNLTNYVVFSGLYAESGRWVDEGNARSEMFASGMKKIPGYSWVEVKNMVPKSERPAV